MKKPYPCRNPRQVGFLGTGKASLDALPVLRQEAVLSLSLSFHCCEIASAGYLDHKRKTL